MVPVIFVPKQLMFIAVCQPNTGNQGRNQLFISGEGKFHELSFDDVIVLIQPWYNFFANGHRYVLFATFPKIRIYYF